MIPKSASSMMKLFWILSRWTLRIRGIGASRLSGSLCCCLLVWRLLCRFERYFIYIQCYALFSPRVLATMSGENIQLVISPSILFAFLCVNPSVHIPLEIMLNHFHCQRTRCFETCKLTITQNLYMYRRRTHRSTHSRRPGRPHFFLLDLCLTCNDLGIR